MRTCPPACRSPRTEPAPTRKVGLARALSKLGYCSRSKAAALIAAGRVRLNGRTERDLEAATVAASRIEVDGRLIGKASAVYLMLNKPRGQVTTAMDEQARTTVYANLRDATLPWVAPVGRLDKASEGLLLFTNDSEWAAALLSPVHHVAKTYHVQIAGLPSPRLMRALQTGVALPGGETLAVSSAGVLRAGARNCWLEIVLTEGRNRHIRRMLDASQVEVLRLVRVAIGALTLGHLARGTWRHLTPAEVEIWMPAPR